MKTKPRGELLPPLTAPWKGDEYRRWLNGNWITFEFDGEGWRIASRRAPVPGYWERLWRAVRGMA
jgi:hypothetical protein